MSLPKNTRFGIIGAGPSGLAAAESLREKGYTDITVIEKAKRVGGMALSLEYKTKDNRKLIYELGSLQPVSSYFLYRLMRKYDIHVGKKIDKAQKREAIYLKLYSINQHKPVVDFIQHKLGFPIQSLPSLFSDFLKLGRYFIRYRGLTKRGFNVPPPILEELSVSYDDWITRARFKVMELPLRMLGVTMTMANPKIKNEIPALLIMKLFLQIIQRPFNRLRYINGLHKLTREGYQTLWNRIAEQHSVLLGENIISISRHNKEVTVTLENKVLTFDKLIVTCSPTKAMRFLDTTPEEKALFSKIHYSPGWRAAFIGKNLPTDAAYSFIEPYMNETFGPFLQGFYPEGEIEENVWLYSCGISLPENKPIQPYLEKINVFLREEFKGEVIEWLHPIFWPEYVPHFLPEDTRNGIYQQLENLQGKNNTYYSGGTFAGHSHATVAEYSYELVKKYFP